MSDIRRLQTFLDFVRLGTVAAVARESQYSTSAVSQQLDRLAAELGVPLLEPNGRALRLTPAGQALAGLGRGLLDDWEEIQATLAATTREVVGSVTIAAFQTGCLALFPPLLEEVRAIAPGVRVSCAQAEPERSLPALRAREIDIAVVEHYSGQIPAPVDDLATRPLFEDGMVIAVSEQWLSGGRPNFRTRRTDLAGRTDYADFTDRAGRTENAGLAGLAALADRPWVFEAKGSPARAWAESLCHQAGFSPWIAHETSDVAVQCALAASGAAAAFIPELTPQAIRGGASCVALPSEHSRTVVAISRRSSAEHPAVRAVLTSLETVAAVCR